MGLTADTLMSLLFAKQNGIDFKHTLTIGRQSCHVKIRELDRTLKRFDSFYTNEKAQNLRSELIQSGAREGALYLESLLMYLGAELVDSIDYSDYEKATLIHDMNKPIPHGWKNRFSCVLDGGTHGTCF